MKIAITGDWHLDASTGGFDRFNDVSNAIDEMLGHVIDEKVDLFVFLGDLCDPDANRSPRCVAVAINAALRLSNHGIASRWLVGNHDVIEDGSGSSTLEPLEALRESVGLSANVRVVYEPELERIGDASFVWLPYVPRCLNYNAANFVRDLGEIDGPIVVASHLSVRGIDPGSETHDMPRGRDLWLPLGEIATNWIDRAFVVNGHYHKAHAAERFAMPGSLARMTFGEEGNPTGFLILETPPSAAGFVQRRIELSSRQVVTLPGAVAAEQIASGAIVRIKPPVGMTPEELDSLISIVRGKVSALKILPIPTAQCAVLAPIESPVQRRSVRSVVDEMLQKIDGVDLDKNAVVEFVGRILDEEGI